VKDPLRRLRPEVALPLGTRADLGVEHEVEVKDPDIPELLAAGRAGEGSYGPGKGLRRHAGCALDPVGRRDVVRPEVLLAAGALDHLVREALHVPGGDVDGLEPDGRALDLVEPLPEDVESPPDILDAPLHLGAQGPVVDEACHAPVDLA
jgi:hypothetical protein